VLAATGARTAHVGALPLDALRMLAAIEWEDPRNDPAAAEPTPTPLAAAALERAERRRRHGGSGGSGWPGGSDGASTSSGASTSGGDRRQLALARTDSSGAASCSGASTCGGGDDALRSPYENPSRHLLSRPSALQLLSTLSATTAALPRNAVLLLHLCSSQLAGIVETPSLGPALRNGGGASSSCGSGSTIATSTVLSVCSEISADCGAATAASDSPRAESLWSDMSALSLGQLSASAAGSESGGSNPPGGRGHDPSEAWLAPEDLLPLTRRSMLVVVDGEGAQAFAKLQVRGCRPLGLRLRA
jgi:hypothetical protein